MKCVKHCQVIDFVAFENVNNLSLNSSVQFSIIVFLLFSTSI
jgi:hypothetical protein